MTVDPVLSSVLESLEAEGDNVLLCWGNTWFCSGLPDSSSAAGNTRYSANFYSFSGQCASMPS